MDPEPAGEEVEAAVVAADLVRAEENAILVTDEELASRVAALVRSGQDFVGASRATVCRTALEAKGLRNFAFAVAIGGKADMACCSAYVCF